MLVFKKKEKKTPQLLFVKSGQQNYVLHLRFENSVFEIISTRFYKHKSSCILRTPLTAHSPGPKNLLS